MDKFEIILLSQALRFYKKCPTELGVKLNECFEILETNPFYGPNIKLLKSKDKLYRYRVGGHRVIYEINKAGKKVGILLIAPRPSAYRNI